MKDATGRPQNVVLLGAGSDIGISTVRRFASQRVDTIVLAGRQPDAYAAVADELRAAGASRVEVIAFDADATETHEAFVNDVAATVGDIDVAILAWGVLPDQAEAEQTPATVVDVICTNFTGAASVGVALANRMKTQGHGTIVALSSVAAERPRKSNFVYGASKAGLDAFFTGLGDSLAGSGVSVLVVRPGFVHTKMTAGLEAAPLATTPDEVADAIIGALESNATQIWVPRTMRPVMTVLRHVPRAIFRRLPI